MRKIKLDIDGLTVDSYEMVDVKGGAEHGTVEARGVSLRDTCANSCPYTCGACFTIIPSQCTL